MGDIWPYGPPRYTNWQQCYDVMLSLGFSKSDANIMAAIGGSEAAYDLSVVNDTPATGDYSVGVWQINYYDGLYSGRVAEFGTPKHLAQSTVTTQGNAARQIWASQGFDAWGSYHNGHYRAYLNNSLPSGPTPIHEVPSPSAPVSAGSDSWSSKVDATAVSVGGVAKSMVDYARVIRAIRGN